MERVGEIHKLEGLLKQEYPTLYEVAKKLTQVMEQRLKKLCTLLKSAI